MLNLPLDFIVFLDRLREIVYCVQHGTVAPVE
jgi:hypothetical protein